MKVKFYYRVGLTISGTRFLWSHFTSDVIDEYKYSKWYNLYLCLAVDELDNINSVSYFLKLIKKIERRGSRKVTF